jgi:hypothetical protein
MTSTPAQAQPAPPPATPPPSGGGKPGGATPSGLGSRFGTFVLSLVFVEVAPLFPILVESMKNGGLVGSESFLLTAAVMAVGFGISSETDLFRGAYTVLFLTSVGIDFKKSAEIMLIASGGPMGQGLSGVISFALQLMGNHLSLLLLMLTLMAQFVERFIWHMIEDKKFPDWKK